MPRRGLRWHVVSEAATTAGHEGTLKKGEPVRRRTGSLGSVPMSVIRSSFAADSPAGKGRRPCTGLVHAPVAEVSGRQQIGASANQAGLMHGEERVVPPLVQELAVEACRLPAGQLSEQDRIELVHHGSYLPSGTRSACPGGGQGCAVGWSGGCGSHRDLSLVEDCAAWAQWGDLEAAGVGG